MKGYKVGRVGKCGEQRCQVAVAYENLWMLGDLFQINRLRIARGQQVVRSISSSCANNRSDIVAYEHVFEFARTALGRTGKVQVLIQDRVKIKRLIAGTAKTVAARLQHFALQVRGRRNDSHLVARTERARLDSRMSVSGNHLDSIFGPSEPNSMKIKSR